MDYYPGDTYDISSSDNFLAYVYYGNAEEYLTAQTGDTNDAVIPLAILAAVCATALIAHRKTIQG